MASEWEEVLCARWNALWPAGSEIELVNDFGKVEATRTRSEAWQLGHGAIVVLVEGRTGGYDLSRIIPVARPVVAVAQPIEAEPNGGNVYRTHPLLITSGQFWRCKHGSTGHGESGLWVGCGDCAADDSVSAATFEAVRLAATGKEARES